MALTTEQKRKAAIAKIKKKHTDNIKGLLEILDSKSE